MKTLRGARFVSILMASVVSTLSTAAVTFTTDTIISFDNTGYEGADIVLTNCTVTVDGVHSFASLRVRNGGVLTHSFNPAGLLTANTTVTNEPHVLNGTGAVTLNNSNVVTASVVVTDNSGMITYVNGVDYLTGVDPFGQTTLQRVPGTSIPDGASVLVSYGTSYSVPSGLNLAIAGDASIDPGGAVNANAKGYGGGQGPGAGRTAGGVADGSGAGHGGYGGMSSSNAIGGNVYDWFVQPSDKGSGGGSGLGGLGGNGGGAVKLTIGGTLQISGSISANGQDATNSRSGGGSGGSIWLSAHSVTGNGSVFANGGAGEPIHGGGAGGGRIAIQSDLNTFSGSITAWGGVGSKSGGAGTVFTQLTGQHGLLVMDNGGRAGTNSPVAITDGSDMLVRGNASVVPVGAWTIGNMTVSSNGLVVAVSQVNGFGFFSSLLSATGNVTIEAGGGVVADLQGYPAGQGAGAGRFYLNNTGTTPCGGGGYGGYGASGSFSNAFGGIAYGLQDLATDLGSGGGNYLPYSIGGAGGGSVRLYVAGFLRVDGRISANGGNGSGTGGGGGSGGSLWLTAGTLSGAGSILANGGNGADAVSGGGGGGRIDVYPATNLFGGTIGAWGGSGAHWGGAGTLYTQNALQNPQLIVDNAGHSGTNTMVQSVASGDLILRNGAMAILSGQGSVFGSLWVGSNAWLVGGANLTITGNATIQPGGGYNADSKGNPAGQGPGAGRSIYVSPNYSPGGGAGHGGYGANAFPNYATGGNTYDSATGPITAGSGGGNPTTSPGGGSGGGAARFTVNGTLLLDGKISANGGDATGSGGGGSGGSIWLTVGGLSGAGSITANGGRGADFIGGGGGGGRIAVYFNTNGFAGTVTAYGAGGGNWGGAGTIYLKSNQQTYGQLILDNGGNFGTNTTFISGGVDLVISGGSVGQWPSQGALVRNLQIRSNSVLSATAPIVAMITLSGDATIDAGAAISADGAGYGAGQGPGSGSSSSRGGGGYGGIGAANPPGYGSSYGSIVSPSSLGSGGGSGSGSSYAPLGGAGGGSLHLNLPGKLTLNGRISANGMNGDINSGGGSGGSVWINAGTIAGVGAISANGGSGNGAGGGGGGRIALNYLTNSFAGSVSAFGGGGVAQGGAGTVYTKPNSQAMGQVLVDNGGSFGTNTPVNAFGTFNLTIRGGGVVHPSDGYLVLSNLLVDTGGCLTSIAGQTNLNVAILSNAVVAAGGLVSVDAQGFAQAAGPGAGSSASGFGAGAGYGGYGGNSTTAAGGVPYGSATQPVDRGSGGGLGSGPLYSGSQGGGAIRLNVGGTLTVNGWISAEGNAGLQDNSGGGSGGSIWVTAGTLAGIGSIAADGGPGELYGGGGGSGGRIALHRHPGGHHTTNFSGTISAYGAAGYYWGDDGMVLVGSDSTALQVLSQTPVGIVSNAVSSVDVTFNTVVNPYSFASTAVLLTTPNGPVSSADISVSMLAPAVYRVYFPQQTALGNYTITVGPQIEDLYGQPMAQAYAGSFAISLPYIQGWVTDTNGLPIAGVVLQPDGGMSPATTDSSGNYMLGFVPGSSFTVTPSMTNLMFAPGSMSYSGVTTTVSNQNYIAVGTIGPTVGVTLQTPNLALGWYGLLGVHYQVYCSTNLVDWQPYGEVIAGSNAAVQVLVPIDSDPLKFFRIQAGN